MGHTAWAPEGRYQAGPKGRNLEVGARRAPRLLVLHILPSSENWLIWEKMGIPLHQTYKQSSCQTNTTFNLFSDLLLSGMTTSRFKNIFLQHIFHCHLLWTNFGNKTLCGHGSLSSRGSFSKIMQCAKLYNVHNHAKCKIMQNTQLCKVQSCAKCKIVQSAKLCKVENYAMCKIIQEAKLWGPTVQGPTHATNKQMQQSTICFTTNL